VIDRNIPPAGSPNFPILESEDARGVDRLFQLEFQSLILRAGQRRHYLDR
jgi:hypothetical protein